MIKQICRGAEAVLYQQDGMLVKERIKKGYRYSVLDEQLRIGRTKREAKLLEKCNGVVAVPKLIKAGGDKIFMGFVDGELLRNVLGKLDKKKRIELFKAVGGVVGKLHCNHMIHGDLTTSNMIVQEKSVVLIDFGLGFVSKRDEDKAVDLHLLKQALESKHHEHAGECFDAMLSGYVAEYGALGEHVIKRLEKVEARGRYKGK